MATRTESHYIELYFVDLIALGKVQVGWNFVIKALGCPTIGAMEMYMIVVMFVLIAMLGTQGIFLLTRSIDGMVDETTFLKRQ